MDRPCVGGAQLVDWCTCRPTCRALKTRSCSKLHPWKVHAWEVFDWWSGAFVDQFFIGLNFICIFFLTTKILVLLSASVERFGVSCMQDILSSISCQNYICNVGCKGQFHVFQLGESVLVRK